jgi:NAD dependent epimerase/dehydratase family enzyme
MLATVLPLFRLGLAAKFGDGRQLWPWIALDEMAPAMMHVINETDLAGPVNFVAPDIVSNAEFTDAVAAAVGRPSFLTVPSFAAKLAPGGMSEELLLRGARVVPARLLETGYEFRHPELRGALRSMLG